MMMNLSKILILAVSAATLLSCSHSDEWRVKGKIEGAEGKTLVLEAGSNGVWYALDSLTLKKSGDFSFTEKAFPYPDIYRLTVDGSSFYFPIDSVETVEVIADINNPTAVTLSGSTSAEKLMAADKLINKYATGAAPAEIVKNKELKRELGNMLLEEPNGIVAYYILNKKIGGQPLYDPTDKLDIRVIGAVANAYDNYMPDDPRTKFLKTLFLSNKKRDNAVPKDTLVATEVPIIELSLYDNTGKEKSLTETAQQNKVVLLSFTQYSADFSPAYNVELNKVYEKYHQAGLEIYQISYDPDDYQWRQSAKNLPWITVFNPTATNRQSLIDYNVGKIPTTFVIANGELVDRVEDPTKLSGSVAKYF
ncbi:MAG: DUF4369 domain-containing protein [Paramuribaculum sp.]|nr:DUF4369 domain-containing protein [Paramuribaculum sp.]